MATAVTTQKLKANLAVESYDHDPGGTTAVVTSPDGGTTPRWVDLRDFGSFLVVAKPTVVGGAGLTLLEILGAVDAAGTDAQVVLSSGAVAADSLNDYVALEVLAEQVREVGDAAGKDLRYVAARLTMGTATDEACVTYIRGLARHAKLDLTATNIT